MVEDEESFVDSPISIPKEPIKTLLAFIFLFFAWVATTTSLALTHERVPNVDPLPDVVLDNVNYQSWGLDASEIIIMIATFAAFILSLFHQHRYVVVYIGLGNKFHFFTSFQVHCSSPYFLPWRHSLLLPGCDHVYHCSTQGRSLLQVCA